MRIYKLTVEGPATFTTYHDRSSWALAYAQRYIATWPEARITLTATTA